MFVFKKELFMFSFLIEWFFPWKNASTIENTDGNGGVLLKGSCVYLTRVGFSINKLEHLTQLPVYDEIFCFENGSCLHLLAHFTTGAGFRYHQRRDNERRKIKLSIFPKNVPFDRTHLIPFGYHNQENNRFLIIGWNREDNQTTLRLFEEKQKTRQCPIYWQTLIDHYEDTVTFTYNIFNEDFCLLDSIKLESHGKFMWKF